MLERTRLVDKSHVKKDESGRQKSCGKDESDRKSHDRKDESSRQKSS